MEQNNLKVKIKAQWRRELAEEASRLHERLPVQMQHVMDCSSENRASNWLAVLPLEELGFSLHKGAFCDALCLRFGSQPLHILSNCVCGKRQTVEHALSCSHGIVSGNKTQRYQGHHSQMSFRSGHNVAVEPELQPIP